MIPGQLVKTDDGRRGSVIVADWGGVIVQLSRTDTAGAERRVYREEQLTLVPQAELFTEE